MGCRVFFATNPTSLPPRAGWRCWRLGGFRNAMFLKGKNMEAELELIKKLPRHVWGIAWLEMQIPNKINDIEKYCRSILAREERETGWVPLDSDENNFQLPAEEQEELEAWRIAQLDENTEKTLDLLREGGAALGKKMGLTKRRGQQIIKQTISRATAAQGDLFGMGGVNG